MQTTIRRMKARHTTLQATLQAKQATLSQQRTVGSNLTKSIDEHDFCLHMINNTLAKVQQIANEHSQMESGFRNSIDSLNELIEAAQDSVGDAQEVQQFLEMIRTKRARVENASVRRIRSLEQQLQVISAKEEVQVRATIKAGNDALQKLVAEKRLCDEHQQNSSSWHQLCERVLQASERMKTLTSSCKDEELAIFLARSKEEQLMMRFEDAYSQLRETCDGIVKNEKNWPRSLKFWMKRVPWRTSQASNLRKQRHNLLQQRQTLKMRLPQWNLPSLH